MNLPKNVILFMQKQNTKANKTQIVIPILTTHPRSQTRIDPSFATTLRTADSILKASLSMAYYLFCSVIVLLISGCGGQTHYPTDWPALVDKLGLSQLGHNCPDMRGIYSYDSRNDEKSAFEISSTVLGSGVDEQSGTHWSTVTITGDAAEKLTLAFEGSRQNPDDKSWTPLKKNISLQRGTQYTCDSGWLVGERQEMSLISVEQSLPRGTERYPTRQVGVQTARFRRAVDASLVARSDVRETRRFSIWPGTPGIAYWTDVTPRWARWQNFIDVFDEKINSQVRYRIEREIYEKENGVNAVAPAPSATSAKSPQEVVSAPPSVPPAPAATPATLAPIASEPVASVSSQDLQAILENMSDGASLVGVTRQGERIVVRLHITDPVQVASTVARIAEGGNFTDIQHHGTVAGAGKNGIATISMRQR